MKKWHIVPLILVACYNIIAYIYRWQGDVISYLSFATNQQNQQIEYGWNNQSNISRGRSGGDDLNFNNERSIDDDWNVVINTAEASNYSCGGDDSHPHLPTSINATILANNVSISLQRHQEEDISYVGLEVAFRAYDEAMQPQKIGGDVFILDYQSYWQSSITLATNNYTVIRSAAFTIDHADGTYHARLHLPLEIMSNEQNVRVSLRHYYTCHEGLKLSRQLKTEGSHHTLDFGPSSWQKVGDEIQSVLSTYSDDGQKNVSNLPLCTETPLNKQDGIDNILHGIWTEESVVPPLNMSMTSNAKWTPLQCTLDEQHYNHNSNRIGDSTMPHRHIEVGIPYVPYLALNSHHHQSQFMDYISSLVNQSSSPNTILYGGGLHHMFHGQFNIPTTANLLIRATCQIGLAFSKDIFLRGVNPIQQHLYHSVDQTAINARMINWEIRSRLEKSGFSLMTLCKEITVEDLSNFICLSDEEGNLVPNEVASTILLQTHNYSWDRDSSDSQKELVAWIQGLSLHEQLRRYGNRTIGWIDLEEFLLSRPDVYHKNDKIHDNAGFFFHQHHDLLSRIESY